MSNNAHSMQKCNDAKYSIHSLHGRCKLNVRSSATRFAQFTSVCFLTSQQHPDIFIRKDWKSRSSPWRAVDWLNNVQICALWQMAAITIYLITEWIPITFDTSKWWDVDRHEYIMLRLVPTHRTYAYARNIYVFRIGPCHPLTHSFYSMLLRTPSLTFLHCRKHVLACDKHRDDMETAVPSVASVAHHPRTSRTGSTALQTRARISTPTQPDVISSRIRSSRDGKWL